MVEKAGFCPHGDNERILQGTWCSPEIQLALEVGYKPVAVSQIKFWAPDEVSSDSMAEYIRHNFTEKLQWSGIDPEFVATRREQHPHITDGEIEALYIARVREVTKNEWGVKNQIVLQPGIKKDNARRSLAKMMLNSLWVRPCKFYVIGLE